MDNSNEFAGRYIVRLVVLYLLLIGSPAPAQQIGTDLSGLGLCFYGDCEARGSYAADPLGWTNPATLPVAVLPEVPHGAFGSGSYYHLNVGGIGGDLGAGVLTAAWDPWLLQAVAIYGSGSGFVRQMPGVDLHFTTRTVALGAAVDLGRTSLSIRGLCLGLFVALPVTNNDLTLTSQGLHLVEAHEHRGTDITVGAHWRTGEREWFMLGGFVNGIRNNQDQAALDPTTGDSSSFEGTNDEWFARAGMSVLPFVPVHLRGSKREWLESLRLGADVAYSNLAVSGEGTTQRAAGYFGVDIPVVPDVWNPAKRIVRPVATGGVDTNGGWGLGLGLQGAGPLAFLSCNSAHSSRPLADSLGDRVDVWAATCTVIVPL